MRSDGFHWRIIGVILLAIVPTAIGFILGIVPGLVLGFLDWHEGGAVVIALIWGVGYVTQRSKGFGDANYVTVLIAAFGGLGLWSSVWLFGNITS